MYPLTMDRIRVHTKVLDAGTLKELESVYGSSDFTFKPALKALSKVKEMICMEYASATVKVRFNILQIPKQTLNKETYHRVLRRVATLVEMFQGRDLEFWFLPCSNKRRLPKKDKMITSEDVNGGFTFHHLGKVYLFRELEFPKVALHETLHNLVQFDIRHWPNQDLRALYEAFQVDASGCTKTCMSCCHTRLEPNEAIIELWAVLFQILFIANEMRLKDSAIAEMIGIEQAWAKHTSALLIERGAFQKPWREETHLLSYILVKSAMFQNLGAFLEIPVPYDSKTMTAFILECVRRGGFAQKGAFSNKEFRFAWFSDQ